MSVHIPHKVAAWVFDCDGVLLDTVKAKVAAFRAWVPEEHASLREDFNRYNLAAFGRSRRVQLRHFHEVMLGRSITEGFLDAEVARFARLNLEAVRRAPWLPGSREFIELAANRGTPLFVLSGTPEPELRDLLQHHGVTEHFREIIGSPATKVDGLKRIVAGLGAAPSDVWFVGDATHDYDSAREAATNFIYKPSEAAFSADREVTIVQSLLEISYE